MDFQLQMHKMYIFSYVEHTCEMNTSYEILEHSIDILEVIYIIRKKKHNFRGSLVMPHSGEVILQNNLVKVPRFEFVFFFKLQKMI